MRPNFALSLSFSGIQLLQRQATGWGRVGDVDVTSADLNTDLAALLDKARALGGGPVETKLIIPDDQIKYLTVDASGLGKAELQSTVLASLDGATPYAVEELEFDFANQDGNVFIAAVAKETLQEAEAFANEYGFAPMGYVAAPSADKFPNEPNFGVSDLAKSKGISKLETDTKPAIATGNAIAVPAPKPAAPVVAATPTPVPEPKPEAITAPTQDVAPTPGFSSRRATPKETTPPSTPPRLEGAQRNVDPVAVPAAGLNGASATPPAPAPSPEITGKSDATLNETEVNASIGALRPGVAAEDNAIDDIPDMPARFINPPQAASLHGAADGAPHADLRAPTAPEPQDPTPDDASRGAKLAAIAGTAGASAMAGMRGLLAKRKKPVEAPATPEPEQSVQVQEDPREDEKRRLTVFGARKPKAKKEPIPVGGKPRFLGLILTAILLLFLVSVAAWASVFLDEGLARFFGGANRDRVIAELPDPNAQLDAQETIEVASLESGIDDIAIDDLPASDAALTPHVPPPPLISPEEAAAKYAATGIWLATPRQPHSPPQISLDDVYPASIDKRITGQDAVALAPLSQPRDDLPGGLVSPPPAGSNFAFDENGLVIATPEGVVTPDGALVFLGRPARVPPAIPERRRQAALTPDVSPEASDAETVEPVIAGLRPRVRPKGLVENTERTQLGGITRAELAKLRPKMRPKLEKEVEEVETAEAPATRLAVAASRKPSPRPRNFARIVKRAQKQAEQAPAAQATQVAAVAPRTVKPRIPSNASVAKTATVKNAINLSRVNLIGVYGKPSSRRALVRLSSGRYKKVKVGDRVDGGRVSAIGAAQLIYTKSGRNVTLRMPKG